ncbi:NLRC3 protein [Phytophthora nicotianae]|uniref:NLRC3 protein n=1 Tax=Phytophthora nicotianae TaxID=4792 RepID=A0A0W8D093_PHYNI|nr:NLRC3 protein [Phytophthora nicotianae]
MVQDTVQLDSISLADVLQHVKEGAKGTELHLHRSGLNPSLAVQLADFLETNATLTHVDLTGNRLGEHGAGCLATSLMKNSTVKSLVLDDCGLTSEALKEWVVFFRSGTNTTLRHLSLAHNQIDDDGAEALGAMLQAANTRNMHFDLRGNDLSTHGLQILADAMKNSCPASVTTVQVAGNQDDDEPEAEVYRTRMEFYLHKNMAAIERETLFESIKKIELSSLELVVCHFQHIVLTIAEADSLGAALRGNHSVMELRLEDNALPEEGTRRILRALRTNRSVRTLSLVDNNIGDGGFRELSELLRVPTTTLRAVTIANPTQLTPGNGLEVIAPRTGSSLHYTFANYALLTSLSLANCGLDDLMVGVLVSGIAWSGRIEALDLQRNSFGDRSAYVLVQMMQRCVRLYRLDLLRMLLLGRFPSCEQCTLDHIINAVEQNQTLVQLELTTTHRRTSTSERIASLNTRLRAVHGEDFERERQQRKEQAEIHEKWCRQRAIVHQLARTLVDNLARHTSR